MDYQSGELDRLRRENVVDWMFVEGEIRYIDSFYSNLIKIRADIAARQKHPKVLAPGEKDDAQIRNEIIDKNETGRHRYLPHEAPGHRDPG